MPVEPAATADDARCLWTVGHSNRSIDELVEMLAAERIALVADVRRFPASRAHPQFNRDALEASLSAAAIGYRHFEPLGGRRKGRLIDSPNTAWRVEAFNAYADHLQSPEALEALGKLAGLASRSRAVIMCAEALPWQCHRRLIADWLVAHGWTVLDIVGHGKARPHAMPAFARADGGVVTYPGQTLF